MDYRNIFESSLNEARKIAQLPDDDKFIRIVTERTSNMEKKNFKFRKPITIAASIAVAAVLTVSAGAAMGWDIASLFTSGAAEDRSEHTKYVDKNISVYYENGDYTLRSVSADTEYEMLRSITHEIDRNFNVAGYDVHFTGYAYDGNWFELLYEVGFDNGIPPEYGNRFPIAIATASEDERFESPGWLTKIAGTTQNTIKYRSYHAIAFPDDITIRLFAIEDKDRLTSYIEGMEFESENYVDIILSGSNEYSYSIDTDVIFADGTDTIKNIRISPLGIVLKGISTREYGFFNSLPLLAVFRDGTVTDISKSAGSTDPTDDGMYEFKASYYSNGILLDAREITELRIGDTIIPISG